MEQIGKAEAVLFDKTITFGTPVVEKIVPINSIDPDVLLMKAASVEQLSSHPAARALVLKAQEKSMRIRMPTDFHEIPGAGVEAEIYGEHIIVGSESIFEKGNNLRSIEYAPALKKELESQKSMLAFIAINRIPVGVVVYIDKIRNGVKPMMQRLCELETVILTGDSFDNAKTISEQAGVTRFESDLSPEQKVISVKKLRERYKNIIMVGDGINDAPALAEATVGIAMEAHGTAVSAEAADMVLLVDDITRVSHAIEIGRRTVQIAKQSIYVGLGASFIFMVIASFGLIPPTVGALLQEVFDVAVILKALRVR
ncbi:MAG: HAD-IC family P-type ATPase [Nitrososphaeraceae archaeon]